MLRAIGLAETCHSHIYHIITYIHDIMSLTRDPRNGGTSDLPCRDMLVN